MKKLWEVIKKIFCWLGALCSAIFVVLFVQKRANDISDEEIVEDDIDQINAKAAAKREEAIARIEHADARSICESYGSVCDTIAEGKERFRRRVATGSDN